MSGRSQATGRVAVARDPRRGPALLCFCVFGTSSDMTMLMHHPPNPIRRWRRGAARRMQKGAETCRSAPDLRAPDGMNSYPLEGIPRRQPMVPQACAAIMLLSAVGLRAISLAKTFPIRV